MALGSNAAFRQFGIVTLTVSTTSTGTALPPGGDTLVITNPNTALAWIAVGPGSTPPTAVAGSGIPVLPGATANIHGKQRHSGVSRNEQRRR